MRRHFFFHMVASLTRNSVKRLFTLALFERTTTGSLIDEDALIAGAGIHRVFKFYGPADPIAQRRAHRVLRFNVISEDRERIAKVLTVSARAPYP